MKVWLFPIGHPARSQRGEQLDQLVDGSIGQGIHFFVGTILDRVIHEDSGGIEAEPLRLALGCIHKW